MLAYVKTAIQKLKHLGRAKNEEPSPEFTFKMWEHNCWGDNIEWHNWDRRRISGHISDRWKIKPGTHIHSKMSSGRVAVFKVIDVKYPEGVWDMFFATVKDLGYLDEML